MGDHPHKLHLGLFIALLVLEFTVFRGNGIISTLGGIGLGVTEGYTDALAGDATGMAALIPSIITFVATLVIYYLLAGAIVLLFGIFRRKEPAKQ